MITEYSKSIKEELDRRIKKIVHEVTSEYEIGNLSISRGELTTSYTIYSQDRFHINSKVSVVIEVE